MWIVCFEKGTYRVVHKSSVSPFASSHQRHMFEQQQEQNSRKAGLNSKLCPHIARRLPCPTGNQCSYSHDLERFAGVPYADCAPCESWTKSGQCAQGSACGYSHAQQAPSPALRTTLSSSSSSTARSSIAVRALSDPPELGQHSSQEMLTFLRHYSDRAEVCCSALELITLSKLVKHYIGIVVTWHALALLRV
jgi:hypothetical protein